MTASEKVLVITADTKLILSLARNAELSHFWRVSR